MGEQVFGKCWGGRPLGSVGVERQSSPRGSNVKSGMRSCWQGDVEEDFELGAIEFAGENRANPNLDASVASTPSASTS